MIKSIVALAALVATGSAFAQSSVLLFGIADISLSRYAVSEGGNKTALTHSGAGASRLGFRGAEDLGGGMAASFWLESAITPDDGTPGGLAFRRRSTVSLSGNWGELRLGRDHNASYWNDTYFDPFTTNGVGSNIIFRTEQSTTAFPFTKDGAANSPNYVRADNMIGYMLPPDLGGVYGQFQYALHEQVGGQNTGKYTGARLGYTNSKVSNLYAPTAANVTEKGIYNFAIGYGKAEGATPTTVAAPDVTTWNMGALYNFGAARVMGEISRVKHNVAGLDSVAKGWMLGAVVPVRADEFRFSYGRVKWDKEGASNIPTSSLFAVGYVHYLSKRTALYGTYARVGNKDGAMLRVSDSSTSLPNGLANAGENTYDIGIRHVF
jgi:predicted porin